MFIGPFAVVRTKDYPVMLSALLLSAAEREKTVRIDPECAQLLASYVTEYHITRRLVWSTILLGCLSALCVVLLVGANLVGGFPHAWWAWLIEAAVLVFHLFWLPVRLLVWLRFSC